MIARHIDRDLPAGATWHRQLLLQMAEDAPDARPAVISIDTAHRMDEFRRFRHLIRNVYATNIEPAKMVVLMKRLPDTWAALRSELLAFAGLLDDFSDSVEAT